MGEQLEMQFDHTRERDRAEHLVRKVLMDCLPPGIPPSFKKIVSARYVGRNKAVATLVMFDDLPSVVYLSRWAYGWSHRWELDWGAIFWRDGGWVREEESDNPPA